MELLDLRRVASCDEEVGFHRHTSPGIGTFPHVRGLPGLHRASPSTPLDVYSYVGGMIAVTLDGAKPVSCDAAARSAGTLSGAVIPTVDEPFSRHAEAAPPASASRCPLHDGRHHPRRRA